MNQTVKTLKDWFDKLPVANQKEVVEFLYPAELLLTEGQYCGPFPSMLKTGGLYCGPAPTNVQQNVCPTCGRAL